MKKMDDDAGPVLRSETVRQQITANLAEGVFSARDLSAEVKVREREVYEHLDHIRRTMTRGRQALVVTPPECKKCGFQFSKMARLRKPGKCPHCRNEAIQEPLFTIADRGETTDPVTGIPRKAHSRRRM